MFCYVISRLCLDADGVFRVFVLRGSSCLALKARTSSRPFEYTLVVQDNVKGTETHTFTCTCKNTDTIFTRQSRTVLVVAVSCAEAKNVTKCIHSKFHQHHQHQHQRDHHHFDRVEESLTTTWYSLVRKNASVCKSPRIVLICS